MAADDEKRRGRPILDYIEDMLSQLADMAAGQDRGDVEAYIRIAAVVAARDLD